MKAACLITIFTLVCYTGAAINFNNYSLKDGLNKAKAENKKLFVFFSSKWCAPCQIMKDGVFKDERVKEIVDTETIPIIVYFEDRKNYDWIHRYEIKSLPTSLLLDAEGGVVSRYIGSMGTDRFISFIQNQTMDEGEVKIVESISAYPSQVSSLYVATSTMSSNEKKIYIDGILVDVKTGKENNITSASESSEKTALATQPDDTRFAIQLGAFGTLEEVKRHQKFIQRVLTDETTVLIDRSYGRLPYKLVTKTWYNSNEVSTKISTVKASGLDCFARLL